MRNIQILEVHDTVSIMQDLMMHVSMILQIMHISLMHISMMWGYPESWYHLVHANKDILLDTITSLSAVFMPFSHLACYGTL